MARPLHRINEFHKGTLDSDRVEGLDAVIAVAHDPVTVGAGLDVTGQLVELDLSEVSAGGELGGTMDAPTVDASHSGSTHAAVAAYADGLIASEITRANAAYDAAGAASAAQAASQPLDSDLTAVAALSTTAFGRALLELANAAAGRTAFGLGTAAVAATGDFDAVGAAAAAQAASQPLDGDLTAIAALSTTSYGRSLLEAANAAAARTLLALGTAAVAATGDFDAVGAAAAAQAASQPLDSDLTAFAALAIAADKLPYGSGSHALSLADFTAAGRALIDDADAAAQRTTLGLGTAATHATGDYQPIDATLTALAGLATGADKLAYSDGTDSFAQVAFTAAGRALIDDADAAAQRTTLGLGTAATTAATDYQPIDADLTAIAALATDAFGRTVLTKTSAALIRTYLGVDPTAGPDADITVGATGAAGTADTFARSAHGHKLSTWSSIPGVPTIAGSAGTSTVAPARGDHIHPGVETRASMPGSPNTNDRVFRTDLGMEFYYDGTRWLSAETFSIMINGAAYQTAISATAGNAPTSPVPTTPGSDIYLVDLITQFFVVGGTALGALHKWVQTFNKVPTGNTDTLVKTVTISSGSVSVWRTDTSSINALLNNGTLHFAFRDTWTKTGTPGNLYRLQYLTYRVVAT